MQEEEEPREERRGVTVKEIRQRTTKIFVQGPDNNFRGSFFFLFSPLPFGGGRTRKEWDSKDSWPATEWG